MAEFNCQCGKVLENSKTGDSIFVILEQEVLAACQQNPNLTLDDFLANWRRWAMRENINVVYWKCPDCGKVYEAEPRPDGQVFRTFERTERADEVDLRALAEWDKVYVIDSKFLNETEEDEGLHLLFDSVYITRWKYDYFLDPDEKMLLAIEAGTNMSAFFYEDVDKK
ncbi:MAG: hypothetical protein IJ720_00950 [Clostridia bacterium]|nr:hypothetical protein [Clostridia bacterium]MBR1703914.1 hypothetical protein [Clostridia bacterium]